MPTFRVRKLNCTVSPVSDAHSARIRIPSDVLSISLVANCLYSDLLNNFALCDLEAGQENVWSRDRVRRYKKNEHSRQQNNVSNVKHGLLSPYRVGHVPPHNPVYICIVQERYKSNRQPNNSKGNHLSPISSFTRWGPFSSCYFSYIMPSQMSRAWWAPKLQKIH